MQNGPQLFALQELGGWASTEMVRLYLRTWRRSPWRPMRTASVRCVPLQQNLTAPIRHRPENVKGSHRCKPLNFGCGGLQPDASTGARASAPARPIAGPPAHMRKCEDHDLVLSDLVDESKREAIQHRYAAVSRSLH